MFRRYNLFDDFSNIFRSFDTLFRQSFGDQPFGITRPLLAAGEGAFSEPAPSLWSPAVETLARKNEIVVRAELPGVQPEDVEVTVEGGRLILRGEKKEEKRSEDESVYRREVTYGRFERSFALPEGVKADDVKASFRNGVLEVSLPAKGLVPESRRIPVEVGTEKKSRAA